MFHYKGFKLMQGLLWFTSIPYIVMAQAQDSFKPTTVRPGRYVPELFGGPLGKYMPDDSGKYNHIHRPYDGGYGDRGIKYIHDSSGKLIRVPSNDPNNLGNELLGPKDHLRFMIDFNYDNNGWEIIKFEWLRDGDENYKYKYFNENQLWSTDGNSDNGYLPPEEGKKGDPGDNGDTNSAKERKDESDIHIDGEYNEDKGYNYSYTKDKTNENSRNLQQAIKDVLDYIENSILPTL